MINKNDGKILKELSGKVFGYSRDERNFTNAERWTKHNDLRGGGDVLLFADPENGWNEVLPPGRCEGGLAGWLEHIFQRDIIYAEKMGDDKVIDTDIYLLLFLPYVIVVVTVVYGI